LHLVPCGGLHAAATQVFAKACSKDALQTLTVGILDETPIEFGQVGAFVEAALEGANASLGLGQGSALAQDQCPGQHRGRDQHRHDQLYYGTCGEHQLEECKLTHAHTAIQKEAITTTPSRQASMLSQRAIWLHP
jgi:hypothetical protein